MLYVDGMNGVIAHRDTINWLYSLLASEVNILLLTSTDYRAFGKYYLH